jgi:hypothetical protein
MTCCSPSPFFLTLNTTIFATPVPASTSRLVFQTDSTAVSGTPHLNGSDGSSFDAASLGSPSCILPSGSNTFACGVSAAVQGLQPHTTYVVTFPTVTVPANSTSGGSAALSLTNLNAGTFQTQ